MTGHKQVLVLNADNTVLHTKPLKRIINMFISNKITILKTEGNIKLHPSFDFTGIPIIVSLKNYIYIPVSKSRITKTKIFIRDQYICQYCGEMLTSNNATIDHVIPKSHPKFPGNIWENVVTCCKDCNNKKGNKELHDISMQLLQNPCKPSHYKPTVNYYYWKNLLEELDQNFYE